MNKLGVLLLACAVGLLALLAPLSLSLYLAQNQGREAVMSSLHEVANDVLERARLQRAQINTAISQLNQQPPQAFCSSQQLQDMHRLVLGYRYIVGMAGMAGSTLLCNTLQAQTEPLALGAFSGPDPSGLRFWNKVHLPGLPDQVFTLVARDNYAAIIHPDFALDLLNQQSSVSSAFLQTRLRSIIGQRGVVKEQWVQRYSGDGKALEFEDDGYFVVIVPASNSETAALAAQSSSVVAERVRRLALIIAPLGLVLGLLLAALVAYLARRRLSLKGELQAALERDEFFIEYQPIIDLHNGRCVGAEALARWRTQGGKLISPSVFIPMAEANGLIQRITARVMEIVVRDAAELLRADERLHIAINLSSEDLKTQDAEQRLKKLSEEAGMGPRSLMVEITERGLMDPDKSRAVLLAVRANGFQVAIDDFGTGHSSLSYLATYELDYLKIDKMFVDTLGTDAPTSLVTMHIIELARSLGLQMIAEGVENPLQRDILRKHGVQYAQGWLFGRPMSIQHLREFIDQHPGDGTGDVAESQAAGGFNAG
ncbi:MULTISPECIES: EAL domain-containing protein [Pseudomonas]|uniref:EAL domain-containing protein n=1 Tax=Pseudomonas TaxID=286 RepID=UPI000C9C6492|nr:MULTISPECIES: EAL domain-containing protein [Pseudomonas]PNG31398.1 hypothetical protein A1348_15680 [Pseudomonas protegens]